MKRTALSLLLLAGTAAPAFAISGAAPAVDQSTKVTWGRISRIEYSHVGAGSMRIHVQTPAGERAFTVASGSVPVRDLNARSIGNADLLRPGDEVRVYFNVGPNGETVPIEFTPVPAAIGP